MDRPVLWGPVDSPAHCLQPTCRPVNDRQHAVHRFDPAPLAESDPIRRDQLVVRACVVRGIAYEVMVDSQHNVPAEIDREHHKGHRDDNGRRFLLSFLHRAQNNVVVVQSKPAEGLAYWEFAAPGAVRTIRFPSGVKLTDGRMLPWASLGRRLSTVGNSSCR